MRWTLVPIAMVFGSTISLAAIWFGPKEMVICSETRWPNSLFGDMFGHTDGADFTGCDVPTGLTWSLAIIVFVVPVALAIFGAVRR